MSTDEMRQKASGMGKQEWRREERTCQSWTKQCLLSSVTSYLTGANLQSPKYSWNTPSTHRPLKDLRPCPWMSCLKTWFSWFLFLFNSIIFVCSFQDSIMTLLLGIAFQHFSSRCSREPKTEQTGFYLFPSWSVENPKRAEGPRDMSRQVSGFRVTEGWTVWGMCGHFVSWWREEQVTGCKDRGHSAGINPLGMWLLLSLSINLQLPRVQGIQ